jgi:hypothetical protein
LTNIQQSKLNRIPGTNGLFVLECCKKAKSNQTKEAWDKVRPVSKNFPKRTEKGYEKQDLPDLQPGETAVICPISPVVTTQKHYFIDEEFRLEWISLEQHPAPMWCKILPRTSLKDRFMVTEIRAKDTSRRYVVADRARVRQWLRYLFRHHKEFKRMRQDNELEFSKEAIQALDTQEELAAVNRELAMGGPDAADQMRTNDT